MRQKTDYSAISISDVSNLKGTEKANLTVLMLQPRNLIYQFAGRQDGRKQANLPRVQHTTNPSLGPWPHER